MSNRQVVVEFSQDFVDGKVGLDVLGSAQESLRTFLQVMWHEHVCTVIPEVADNK